MVWSLQSVLIVDISGTRRLLDSVLGVSMLETKAMGAKISRVVGVLLGVVGWIGDWIVVTLV